MSQPVAFHHRFDLSLERRVPSTRALAGHQARALAELHRWFDCRREHGGGGLVVMPTGAGKTSTAVRFACEGPLSYGYKVLWLAQQREHLEQLVLDIPPRDSLTEHRAELNRAVDAATADWVLIVRERETVDDALAREIADAMAAGKAWGFRIRSSMMSRDWRRGRPARRRAASSWLKSENSVREIRFLPWKSDEIDGSPRLFFTQKTW